MVAILNLFIFAPGSHLLYHLFRAYYTTSEKIEFAILYHRYANTVDQYRKRIP